MKFDTSKDLNNTFYVNKLHLINVDLFLNQSVDNMQFLLIQKNKKERFIIENIMIKIKNKKRRKQKKQYEMKWKGYTQTI